MIIFSLLIRVEKGVAPDLTFSFSLLHYLLDLLLLSVPLYLLRSVTLNNINHIQYTSKL